MSAAANKITQQRREVNCLRCGRNIFNGIVIRSRVIRVLPDGRCQAKCRCAEWQAVPLRYTE